MLDRRTLFGEMPPLKVSLSDRFIGSKRGGICYTVPLFVSQHSRHRRGSEKLYQTLVIDNYIKRAFWLAYELFEHAGLETLSDFYITADSEMRERLEPYRQLCRFPESHIVEVSESGWVDLLKKIVMLTRLAAQTDYSHYMHLDTAMCFPVECQLRQGLEDHWEQYPESFVLYKPWRYHGLDLFGSFRAKQILSIRIHLEYKHKFMSEIPKFFGQECYDYYLRYVLHHPLWCDGHFFGIPRHHIIGENWKEFLDFIAETQCITTDEVFLALYWHKYLRPHKELYRHIDSFSDSIGTDHEGITIDKIIDSLHFEKNVFYHIWGAFKPTEAFQNFFVRHYQNLNRS